MGKKLNNKKDKSLCSKKGQKDNKDKFENVPSEFRELIRTTINPADLPKPKDKDKPKGN